MRRLLAMFAVLAALEAVAAAPVDDYLPQARLAGKGPFSWFGLRIYDAELWVGEQGYRDGAPFVLELRYARRLSGAKIAQASFEEMEKLHAGSADQRAAWLVRMKVIFPDVKEGTRLAGVCLPGAGVRFYLDGKALASVSDPDFARAFFGIWLDPASSVPKLRIALLLNAAAR